MKVNLNTIIVYKLLGIKIIIITEKEPMKSITSKCKPLPVVPWAMQSNAYFNCHAVTNNGGKTQHFPTITFIPLMVIEHIFIT